jgi:hypothetical protein
MKGFIYQSFSPRLCDSAVKMVFVFDLFWTGVMEPMM